MVRLALWLCIGSTLLVAAGCGGGSEAGSPLENALGYAPKDTPFVVAINTDIEGSQGKSLQAIGERFPFTGQIKSQLQSLLSDEDLDYEKDLKPFLGNEFVVSATDVQSFTDEGDTDDFVGAIEAKDKKALDNLVEKSKMKEIGEKSGAKLYESEDGSVSAIDEKTLVVAGDRKLLEAALARRDGEDSLSAEDFEEGVEQLPEENLVRGYFDIAGLIAAEPGGADARKVKYVAAMDTFGFSASAKDDSLTVDFRLSTDKEELSEGDLPLAPGPESPEVLEGEDGKIGVGLREPEQVLSFSESTAEAIDPAGFGDYNSGKETLEKQLDVDVEEDILAQMDELATRFSIDGNFGLHAPVKDPAAFKRTLDRLGKALPDILESSTGGTVGYQAATKKNDFYALSLPNGRSIVYGVFDGAFVISNDTTEAGALSVSAKTATVEGAKGAVAAKTDAQELANAAARQYGGQLGIPGGGAGASLFTGPLGDLTGAVAAEPEATTGKITLDFDGE